MPNRAPWIFGGLPTHQAPRDQLAELDERLSDLEDYLQEVHRELAFGPVPGAYLVVSLGASEASGAALGDATIDTYTFSYQARVIEIALWCSGGDATVDIESEGSSILSAGSQAVTDGNSTLLTVSDLVDDPTVESDLTFIKDSTDGATPNVLKARIVLHQVTEIDT